GVPGESYLAVLDGFHAHRDAIRFVTCRHEGGASFMAEAAGKLTGRPGVCFVTRGPGASNAAIGIHTAFQDSTPMVVFVGQVTGTQRDREAFQEVDYRQMFGPGTLGYAKWVGEVHDADRLPEYVARAFRVAMQGRMGPVVVALPEDMLTRQTAAAVLPRVEPAMASPGAADLEAVRAMLAGAERPFVIAGGGGWTREAAAALESFAERWQLPVGCSFRCQDVFDNRHPSDAGDVGLGIAPKLAARLREADVVLALGDRLGELVTADYTLLRAPKPTQRLIHVHPGAEELGRVYAPDIAVLASVRTAAPALAALPPPEGTPRWAGWTRDAHADAEANRRPPRRYEGVDPVALVRTVESLVPDDTVFTNGAGNFATWLHRFHGYRGMRHGGRTQLAPHSGAMGYGLPAAIAAALLEPDRQVSNWAGDGDFGMTAADCVTAVAHGATKLVAIVLDNGGYGTIRMHQEREFPGRVAATELARVDWAGVARAHGWWASDRVERTEDFEPAFRAALAAGRPALIHVVVPMETITPRQTIDEIRAAAAKTG
ncbi:MAG TPA: thiamine pyrophosphate-dependent enzyme, partial [Geminicoccaceae bacterium]